MRALGVDALMAMAVPSMAKRGFNICFSDIAEAAGGLPIVLQNMAGPRGANLNPAAMLDLAREVDAIRYVKEENIPSGPSVSALVNGSRTDIDGVIGGGGARYLFEELERGVIATMPAIELLELHVAIMKSWQAGKREAALELYEKSLPLLLLQAPYRMRLTKLILMKRGIIKCDHVREPLPELDGVTRSLILELYARLGLPHD